MRIDAIPIGIDPPPRSQLVMQCRRAADQYEMDKEAGTLVVDRFLYTAMRYPELRLHPAYTLRPATLRLLVANTRRSSPAP